MCGIAGIVRWAGGPVRPDEIERMTKMLAHRGPDGEGILVRNGVAVGHRRLAIIDPATGHQPMANENGTIWITCNGEIYNFRALRQELEGKGHQFRTRSDTEVVLHGYEEWGLDCLGRLRGMFAFGLVDFGARRLVLARDHFGMKPLFYRLNAGYLAFASELATLRQVDDATPTGSLAALDVYLRFRYIPAPHTVYRDVFKLPPASVVVVDFDGKVRGPTTYWDSAFEPEDGISERQWEERVEAAVAESVATHLIADVPFGLLLSGGVDSTSVAFHTNRIVGRPVKAFSVGFAEQEYSELTYAEQAARRCDLELHTELVGDDCLEVLPDLVTHYGEPFGDSSCIPTWYVSRLARSHVPMVLAGDGGDEAFGGYDSYGLWMGAQPRRQVWGLMQSSPRAALAWIAERARRSLAGRDRRRLADWQDNVAFMSEPDRRSLWRPEYHRHIGEWSDSFETAAARAYRWDRLAYAQYVDYQTYLPGDILTKVDVAAMYHGLEVRMPFVDVKVVEVARRLPLPQRCRWNDSVFVGKYVLKKILERTFPREFVYRPKQGFVGPVSTWLGGKRGRQMLEEVLGPPDGLAHEWFHPQAIRGYLAGQGSWNAEILWLLLVLGLWRRANRDVRFE